MKETKFKQTEIGMIPDDWEVKKFKSITTRITVGIANSATHAYSDKGIIMFRNQNIKENKLDLSDLIYIKKEFALKYITKQIEAEDLLIARTGYPGTTCVVPNKFAGSQTFTTLIASPKKDEINSDYCAYFFNSNVGKKLFSAAQIGGAQKNVNAHTLTNILLPLPPTLAEQQKIAKALSDVDNVISTLEKLITKKKNLKQGTMQQLLTGKKRLPGFAQTTATKQTELGEIPADWEVKELGEVCKTSSGGTPSRENKNNYLGSIKWFTTSELKDCLLYDSNEHISENALRTSSAKLFKSETILMAMYGATIGKLGILKTDASTNQACCAIICEKINRDFLYHFLRYNREFIISLGSGAGQPNISQNTVKKLSVIIPSKPEQTAIANVLSSMDKEIEALETKLGKYRNLKTGMMQQLLTGKIRLR